ncbi:hypothetical protein EDC94DRAFT_619191 [Helicostylum pulchrum]|nr:hypothetical protein EDC94DRAFT_619191 [Helicostylum pulchrum]
MFPWNFGILALHTFANFARLKITFGIKSNHSTAISDRLIVPKRFNSSFGCLHFSYTFNTETKVELYGEVFGPFITNSI